MATFSDLMNLLFCFFVLLFSMSTMDAQKLQQVAASFSENFSVFSGGASAIGDGILISNGVSQLNELDDYINSTGKAADNESAIEQDLKEEFEEAQMAESEALAEQIVRRKAPAVITDSGIPVAAKAAEPRAAPSKTEKKKYGGSEEDFGKIKYTSSRRK